MRWLNHGFHEDPEKTARNLLSQAYEDVWISRLARVKRLLNNNCVEVLYFVHDGWRFVLRPEEGDSFQVLTIERNTWGK